MADTPAPSATAHKSVMLGILLAGLSLVTSPEALHFLPQKWALILGGVGSILAGFGITKQIQQNTAATVATGEAVKEITGAGAASPELVQARRDAALAAASTATVSRNPKPF